MSGVEFALSAAQRGVWVAQELQPGSPLYHCGVCFEIDGALDAALLARAVRRAVAETQALRVSFVDGPGGPRQLLHDEVDAPLPLVELDAEPDPEAAAQRWMRADLAAPADLLGGRLFGHALLRLAPARHLFYFRYHHIVLDGWGQALHTRRVAEIYRALVAGGDPGPSPFGSLPDLLAEDAAYSGSAAHERDRRYWLDRFADAPGPLLLAGSSAQAQPAELLSTEWLPEQHVDSLLALTRSARTRWPSVFTAALATYLHRIASVDDLVLGIPMAGRTTATALATPAMMTNELPLRMPVRPWRGLPDLAERAGRELISAVRHQRYRGEDLHAELGRSGADLLAGPVLNLVTFDQAVRFGERPSVARQLSTGRVRDLAVHVYGTPDGASGIRVDFVANPALYDHDEVLAHRDRFLDFLGRLLDAGDAPVGRCGLLGPARRREILEDCHETGAAAQPVLPVRFEEQAHRSPDRTAVESETGTLSYAELNATANRLARHLVERGAGPGTLVAVALPQSADAVVALLAVLKSGAGYVPVDPEHPADRIRHLLADSRPHLVISTGELLGALPLDGIAAVAIDNAPLAQHSAADLLDTDRLAPLTRQHPAYVIYTSGSTGRPKGVVVEHRSLDDYLEHAARAYPAATGSALVHSPLSFDLTVTALFTPLVSGGRVRIGGMTEEAVRRFGRSTLVKATPSHLEMLEALPDEASPSGCLILGGEALYGGMLEKWRARFPDVPVRNAYGPTEATVNCAEFRLEPGEPTPSGPVPIGRPFRNTRMYVLDAALQPLPPGAVGELHIAGPGLARGYLGRPDLTAERFVADPFGEPGSRMYRTGDLARWNADGQLEFAGRTDSQVKVRGHRIELGEIESVLAEHPGVAHTAVVVREDQPGDRRLVAYVATDDEAFDEDALREHAQRELAPYMVPAAVVVLDSLPLTRNGKVDRGALPAPVYRVGGRAPRDPREAALCALFAEALGVPRVGIDDDFFALGGHSLLATRVAAEIRSRTGVEMSVRQVFDTPTVAGISEFLAGAADTAAAPPALVPQDRPARIPASHAQHRWWFLNRLDSASSTYNIAVPLRLRGQLDRDALRGALCDVVRRHETLRTVFAEDEIGLHQVVLSPEQARPDLDQVRTVRAELDSALVAASRCEFDLATDPPLRTWLFTVDDAPDEAVLLLLVHHVAGDGWSMQQLAADVAAAYRARCFGRAPDWPELPLQYADYALWQRSALGSETDPASPLGRGLAYWRSALEGIPDELALPTDRPRPAVASHRGQRLEFEVPAALHEQLRELARSTRTSVFMVVQAAMAVLLTRMGAGTDVPIGIPVAGRQEAEVADLVGVFVNTLVLRTDTAGDPTFVELLARVRDTNVAAYAHQDVPFERLVEELQPDRSLSRHPLFQVMLSWQNTFRQDGIEAINEMPGLQVELLEADAGGAEFDLSVDLGENLTASGDAAGLTGGIRYSADLFDPDTALRIAARLVRTLESAVADPGRPVSTVDVLEPAERQRMLVDWNDTSRDAAELLPALFARQVRSTPAAAAVEQGGRVLSYAELDARANRLARYLIGRGAGPESIVAVALPRSPELIVSLLAVLKSGAAYLPVDPDYPAERVEHLLTDARPAVVLASSGTALPTGVPVELDRLDLDGFPDSEITDAERTAALRAQHPAYVIYTSGSTGRPKGVVVPHAGIGDLAATQIPRFGVGPDSRVLQFASPSFDASISEICMALLAGGCLVLPDADEREPGEPLARTLLNRRITHITLPPAALAVLPPTRSPEGLTVVVAGDAAPADLVEQWGERCTLFNAYGPTETTVDATSWAHRSGIGAAVPIGTPSVNTRVYVLDELLRPVPAGVLGELHVAGSGVARGYLGRPDLTAQRFVANPFSGDGERMYRTGDLVRWNRRGELEFAGRADDQVKIRGFRVEPGEIEFALSEHPEVQQCAVVVREDRPGDRRLVAYVVTTGAISAETMRAHLAARLPEHLVPTAFVQLDELPVNFNGKVDRQALPEPDGARAGTGRAPRGPQEEILCELFADVLGTTVVSIDDNFFHLGGHSLLGTLLASRIRSVFGAEITIRQLFTTPTVAGLSAVLDEFSGRDRTPVRAAERPERLPLSFAQQRMWFLNKLEGPSASYNVPLALRLRGGLDVAALRAALSDVVGRHETLRTAYLEDEAGPYQVVRPPAEVDLEVVAVSADRVRASVVEAARRGFDLATDPPLRAALFAVGGAAGESDEHVLLIVLHHIAADGWSLPVLTRDLAVAYEARLSGGAPGWSEIAVQYADFALWQRDFLGSEEDPGSVVAGQLEYWRTALAGLPEELPLPVDRQRPAEASYTGRRLDFEVPADVHARLVELARANDASLFMVVQAALVVLLSRLGGGVDVPVGSPVAGRSDEVLEGLVGFFVNTVVLRGDVSGDPSFVELVGRVREVDLGAFGHQDVPFERLVEVLNPQRSLSRHPLFQVMLTFDNTAREGALGAVEQLRGLTVDPVVVDTGVAKFDLMFGFGEQRAPDGAPAGLRGMLQFSADLFDDETADGLVARMLAVLAAVTAEPERAVSEVDVLLPGERRRVLEEFNDTSGEQPPAESLDGPEAAPRAYFRTRSGAIRPARGTRLLVLDDQLRPQPVGVAGTLHIGVEPDQVRSGAAEFVPDPHGTPGSVLLRTGRPARWTRRGEVELLDEDTAEPAAAQFAPVDQLPRTPQEEILCGLIADVLGADRVGIHDDFFALGGHSLSATILAGRIRSVLGVHPPIKQIFETPTAAGLAAALAALGDTGAPATPVTAVRPRPARVPLSFGQRRLWLLHQVQPGAAYNVPAALRLRGGLDIAALRAALSDVVGRHESLRTVFTEDARGPYQVVLAPGALELDLPVVQLRREELDAVLQQEVRHQFDLAAEPPLRVRLYELAPDEHVLLLLMHHIAVDGWSLPIIARDLAAAYEARLSGRSPAWPELAVQYSDYALWQRDFLGSEEDPGSVVAGQLEYWRTALAGLPEELPLPVDRQRPAEASYTGRRLDFEVPADVHARLVELARANDASLFMVVQAALVVLLSRLGGGVDVPVGSPVAGRSDEVLEGLVGFFVNTVVLRGDVSGDPSFVELVGRVREVDLGAFGHQDVPFERLVEVLNPQRSLSRHPLFQVMLTFDSSGRHSALRAVDGMPGLSVTGLPTDTGSAKFDLAVELREQRNPDGTPAGVEGVLQYSADLFDHDTAVALARRFRRVLEQVCADPHQPVGSVQLLSPEETTEILDWGRAPAVVAELSEEGTEVRGCYVLDSARNLVPRGVVGELWVTGGADGEPDPFGGPDARMHRTGRRARWTRGGVLDLVADPVAPTAPEGGTGRAPSGPVEEQLCRLFAEVLGLPEVAADAEFFALGGDSILSIELVGRARQIGLVLPLREVFEKQTAEALARVVSESRAAAPADVGTGPVPLTPIGHWLAEQRGPAEHFTQSQVLRVPAGLDLDALVAAWQAVLDRHDALRMVVDLRVERWEPQIPEPGSVPAASCVRRIELAEADETARREALLAEGTAARERIDPARGAMLQAVLFDRGPDEPGLLLVVAHHLVIDAVSWRILRSDLQDAYRRAAAGEQPELPAVGTSLRTWAQGLVEQASTPARAAESEFWSRTLDTPDPLLGARALDPAQDTSGSAERLTLDLGPEVTEAVLTAVPATLRAGVDEVLLAGFSLAVARWRRRRTGTEHTELLLDLEGHGREEDLLGADLSRTVGWFTSLHPVRLDPGRFDADEVLAGGPAAGDLVRHTKEQLRAFPDHGVGFGMLRYLNPDTREALRRPASPQIAFNYLGRFPVGATADWDLEIGLDTGPDQHPDRALAHLLEINAATADGDGGPRLVTGWTWPTGVLTGAEVTELAELWFAALEALAAHAARPDAGGLTPSDVALADIGQADIEDLEDELRAEWGS
ncbi:amino acid adenylation domain-containing protein [Saccharopolyspora sp. NPDC000359]|uniref:amino acid adenylation domain-containing protein n=1 Tax=Saccharopolyspora sp. NPDC000359 TaxID=3154251 RepID=UPI003333F9AD